MRPSTVVSEKEKAPDFKILYSRPFLSQPQLNTISNIRQMSAQEIRDIGSVNGYGHVPPTMAFGRSLRSEIGISGPMTLSGDIFPEGAGVNHASSGILVEYDGISGPVHSFAGVSTTANIFQSPKAIAYDSVLALKFDSEAPATSFDFDMPTIIRVNEDSLSSIAVKADGNISYLVGLSQTSADCNRIETDTISRSGVLGNTNFSGGFNNSSENCLASIMQTSKWNSSFGIWEFGDELSQALAPTFKHGDLLDDKSTNLYPMQEIPEQSYEFLGQTMVKMASTPVSSFVKEDWYVSYSDPEPLLEAVVASASSSHQSALTNADDIFSRTLSGMDSQISDCGKCYSSSQCYSQSFVKAFSDERSSMSGESIILKAIAQEDISFNASGNCSTTDSLSMKSDGKMSEGLPKVTRKRARPGESMRPKPRDRQQIQDRLRELREIIPNGSKCSIDILLEKTIGHMLFLQNVAKHIDNLQRNSEFRNEVENGASCAFELDGDESSHPILVKNLNRPRQVLVMMHCKRRSHFLEIADAIRNLGLSILNGVMETRSEKNWARFIVEATRDIHRIDIMMSLMHLVHVNDDYSSSGAIDQLQQRHRFQM